MNDRPNWVRKEPDGVGETGEGNLQGNRHLLLHLPPGAPWKQRNDVHLDVADIGECLDGQSAERRDTASDKVANSRPGKGLVERKMDQSSNHADVGFGFSLCHCADTQDPPSETTWSNRVAPLLTTRSPAFRPSMTRMIRS